MTQTILLVDDDPSYLSRRKAELEGKGYDVLTATSVEEGIKAFEDNAQITAIISDMQMPVKPGLSAYEKAGVRFAAWIRYELESSVPFIINSRDTSAKLMEYQRELDPLGIKVLDKQVPIQDFVHAIAELSSGISR